MNENERISNMPATAQAKVLAGISRKMQSQYGSRWSYPTPVEDGKITETGADWLETFGHATIADLKEGFVTSFAHWKEWPPTVPQFAEQVSQAKRTRVSAKPSEVLLPRPPDQSDWREQMIRAEIDKNPDWRKEMGETSREYGSRMIGVCQELNPGMARVIGKLRK